MWWVSSHPEQKKYCEEIAKMIYLSNGSLQINNELCLIYTHVHCYHFLHPFQENVEKILLKLWSLSCFVNLITCFNHYFQFDKHLTNIQCTPPTNTATIHVYNDSLAQA